ncbi:hypothetical protein JXB11_01000 [Candidatus Woesearchaeota archaeon]|nr:hypothetical protein [Candidatus Woesearchaeota archaeon]
MGAGKNKKNDDVLVRLMRKNKVQESEKIRLEEPDFLKEIDLGIEHEPEDDTKLWLSDGRVVKNIEELAEAVKTMKNKAFKEHVTKEKNEISEWVREIAGNPDLAAELEKTNSRRKTAKILRKFLEKPKETPLFPPAERLLEEKELPAPPHVEEKELPSPGLEQVIVPKKEKKEAPQQADAFRKEEMMLLEEESQLNMEEERLNAERVKLSNKRYELIKRRGELERRKFEDFLEQHKRNEISGQEVRSYPKVQMPSGEVKAQVFSLIDQAKSLLKEGRLEEAKEMFRGAKRAFDKGMLAAEDRKKIEYDILGLETEIRLAALG